MAVFDPRGAVVGCVVRDVVAACDIAFAVRLESCVLWPQVACPQRYLASRTGRRPIAGLRTFAGLWDLGRRAWRRGTGRMRDGAPSVVGRVVQGAGLLWVGEPRASA